MKLFHLLRRRRSDDEYVDMLRRLVAWWDRWFYWLVFLNVAMLGCLGWMVIQISQVLLENADPEVVDFTIAGLLMGAALGFGFGWMFYSLLHGLIVAISGFRAERLLLKYYDSTNSQLSEEDQHRDYQNGLDETSDRYNVR